VKVRCCGHETCTFLLSHPPSCRATGKCILRDQAERISLDAQFIEDLLETAAGRLLGRSSEALEGSALRSGCKVTGNL
jgi:hypothetical protein